MRPAVAAVQAYSTHSSTLAWSRENMSCIGSRVDLRPTLEMLQHSAICRWRLKSYVLRIESL